MKELSTKGMFFNDLDQAERDTLVAVAILQIMHAQPRFDASPNQDGGNVISVYCDSFVFFVCFCFVLFLTHLSMSEFHCVYHLFATFLTSSFRVYDR